MKRNMLYNYSKHRFNFNLFAFFTTQNKLNGIKFQWNTQMKTIIIVMGMNMLSHIPVKLIASIELNTLMILIPITASLSLSKLQTRKGKQKLKKLTTSKNKKQGKKPPRSQAEIKIECKRLFSLK